MAKLKKDTIVANAQAVEDIKAEIKQLYERMDKIIVETAPTILEHHDGQLIHDGKVVTVVDNFTDKDGQPKNVAFKAQAFRHFEL